MVAKQHQRIASTIIGCVFICVLSAIGTSSGNSKVGPILQEFAKSYSKVVNDSVSFIVQVDITPSGESWFVVVAPEKNVEVSKGNSPEAAFTLKMSKETLNRLQKGTMTAFTAAAKGSGGETAPLEMEFHTPLEQMPDPKGTMLGFLQHFFVLDRPERTVLKEEYSRIVHGASAIPLYYATGFRSSWYRIAHGQRLNEPGDTNPYPQAFIIISGRGHAKIGDVEVEVKAGESYYIPPNSDHILWAGQGEGLELIWLAWGEGA